MGGLDHGVFLHVVELEPARSALLVVSQPEEPESLPHPQHYPAPPGLGVDQQPAAGHLSHIPGYRYTSSSNSRRPTYSPEDDAVPAAGDELVLGVPAEVPHGDLGLVTGQWGQGGAEAGCGPEVGQGGGTGNCEEISGANTETEADHSRAPPGTRSGQAGHTNTRHSQASALIGPGPS